MKQVWLSFVTVAKRRPQVPEKTFTDFGIQVDLFEKACVDFESQVFFSDPMCEIFQRRIDELEKNNKQLLSIWCPISITCDEAELQKSEGSLKKLEILSIITSLIPSLGDLDRLYFRGLSNKSCEELVNTFQEVKNILAENNISVSEE
ncbi:28914_t:CDS:2 [Dentiscutata erythropus]|uniref:28914_t:CDS:1 n=1 Tax=Dentiscutata erythropus TaxID=1348616 RepID=A0A9N8VEW3_9GLOM|nr:28914_t:CDS:2 [Dentiscutata erythropus]